MPRQSIDGLMRDYSGNVPGASVLVVREGQVVFRQSYGMANLEERVASTSDTHYRLASLTKQFTAAAILTLAERGRLSLDDPITRFLPELSVAQTLLSVPAQAGVPVPHITIRHLLTHTSGLYDYEDLIPPGATKQLKDIDVLHLLEAQRSTYFPPGSRYRYSNSGYVLLALVVERASGQRFADFLRQSIFEPIGMKSSVAFEEGISSVPNRAYGYSREGSGWRRTDQSITSATLGDGGVYTSVNDLVFWLRALDSGRFDAAIQPQVATDEPHVHYGFGWYVGSGAFWHHGETMGFRNFVIRFPDQHLAVVVLTNRNEGTPREIAFGVRRLAAALKAPKA